MERLLLQLLSLRQSIITILQPMGIAVLFPFMQTLFDKGMRNTHYVPYDKIDNAPDERKVRE